MIKQLLLSLRPKSWTKNFFVFAALLFSLNFFNSDLLLETLYGFFLFCLLAGAVYIINDLKDFEADRIHPEKAKRPIASGRLKKSHAVMFASIFTPMVFTLIFSMNRSFFFVALAYFSIQLLHAFIIKNIVILDLFTIASGFLLRVIAGAVIINVEISAWILVCTFLLALFLGFCKRRHELTFLKGEAIKHRKVLLEYNIGFIDQMVSVVTASTLIAYILYTMSEETIKKFGTKYLILTVPFVLYGIFRYLYLVYHKEFGGSPEQIVLKDRPTQINLFLWALSAIIILYLRVI